MKRRYRKGWESTASIIGQSGLQDVTPSGRHPRDVIIVCIAFGKKKRFLWQEEYFYVPGNFASQREIKQT